MTDTLVRRSPYAAEAAASRQRPRVRPKTVGALLTWFISEWNTEIPTRIHGRGVWRDQVQVGEYGGGGSLLGTPADATPFRRYIEQRGTQRDIDGNYIFPMHAVLQRLAGRGETSRTYMARYLFAIASSGGDWQGVAYRAGLPPQVAEVYLEGVLNRAWNMWEPAPLPREDVA